MKKMVHTSLVCVVFSASCYASASTGKWDSRLTARAGLISEDDLDSLSGAETRHDSAYALADFRLARRMNENARFFSETRAFYATGDINLETEDGGREAKSFIELRQLYLNYLNVIKPGIDFSLGRKRLQEQTGLWWDRNYTVAEISYNRSLISAALMYGTEPVSFRSDDSGFKVRDEDISRVLAFTRWQWTLNHYLDVRYSYINDSSGAENTLDLADNEFDLRDAKASWLGLELSGLQTVSETLKLGYHLGYTQLSGDVTDYMVNGIEFTAEEKNAESSMLNVDLVAQLDTALKPALGIQYFQTSDDEQSGVEGRYFQSGLESNKAKLTGKRDFLQRFNDAYRAELSNVDVFGFFAGVSLTSTIDVNVVYNQFTRVNPQLGIGDNRVDAVLVNGEDDLGAAADIVLSYKAKYNRTWLPNSEVRFRASQFSPGDAYRTEDGGTLGRRTQFLLEWKVSY